MKKNKDNFIPDSENASEEKAPISPKVELEMKRRKAKTKKFMTSMDRLFAFLLVTVVFVVIVGFGVVYVATKGPSPELRDHFVMTMKETRRFDFLDNLFLTSDEVNEIVKAADASSLRSEEFDQSLVKIASADVQNAAAVNSVYPTDDDGDGIIYEEFTEASYAGYILTILDPTRVFVGVPDNFYGAGITLEEMVKKYDALGGVNGGGFLDENGTGSGGVPNGLTVVDGECIGDLDNESAFLGFDDKGLMHVCYANKWYAEQNHIQYGVSFAPILIMNGEPVDPKSFQSGVNPRTVVGQRDDGAVILLVIDGRQANSIGATYADCQNIMLSRGVVNAMNMDGGSSSSMYWQGKYVNRNSSVHGARQIPTAILFK